MRSSMLRRIACFAAVACMAGCYSKCMPTKTVTAPRHGGEGPIAVALPPSDSLGSISGRLRFVGTPPLRAPIEMSEASCLCLHVGGTVLEETVEVGPDGGLKNAMVWVAKGLDPALAWPLPAKPAVLTQAGCLYVPHVLSMRARQPLEVRNDDDVSHNVHTHPKLNEEDNWSQGPRHVDLLTTTSRHRTFTKAEDPFLVGCDVHGWMGARVGVFRHPFHAVTGEDGEFRLEGVPEGKLTLRIWHEKLGTRDVEVEVKRGVEAAVESEFGAP
ncbi:MAG: hypothetical protein FD180_2833 [Planctomycetota bacterium]|nr:MAG: hypothetical protein FD180_2833 [Planctomycetota bacterium]